MTNDGRARTTAQRNSKHIVFWVSKIGTALRSFDLRCYRSTVPSQWLITIVSILGKLYHKAPIVIERHEFISVSKMLLVLARRTCSAVLGSTTNALNQVSQAQTTRFVAPNTTVPSRFYHENIVEHYENPRNVGSFDKNDASVGTVSDFDTSFFV